MSDGVAIATAFFTKPSKEDNPEVWAVLTGVLANHDVCLTKQERQVLDAHNEKEQA